MSVKVADTFAPMGDFPLVEAPDVSIQKSGGQTSNLQTMYDNGELGGGKFQYETMPPASTLPGAVVQYVGETGTYHKASFYSSEGQAAYCYTAEEGGYTYYFYSKEISPTAIIYAKVDTEHPEATSIDELVPISTIDAYQGLNLVSISASSLILTNGSIEMTFNHTAAKDLSSYVWVEAAASAIDEVAREHADEALAILPTKVGSADNMPPASPSDKDVVLYVGEDTSNYKKGHTYQAHTYFAFGQPWTTLVFFDTPDPTQDSQVLFATGEYYYLDGWWFHSFSGDSTVLCEVKSSDNPEDQLMISGVRYPARDYVEWVDITDDASGVSYNNQTSGLQSTNVQGAIDELSETIQSLPSPITPRGTVAFANLPNLADAEVGWMYNISDDFVTTSDFVISGISEKAGSNVYCINTGTDESPIKKWDVFAAAEIVLSTTPSDKVGAMWLVL